MFSPALESLRYRPKLRQLRGDDVATEVGIRRIPGVSRLEVTVTGLVVDPTDMFSLGGRTNYEIMMGEVRRQQREKVVYEAFEPAP